MRFLLDELVNAAWATKQASRDAFNAFLDRLPYWWAERDARKTINMVESWWREPEKCPH